MQQFLLTLALVVIDFVFPQLSQEFEANVLGIKDEVIQTQPVPANQEQAIVTKVIDGDTIKVEFNGEKHTVRIIGLDTPETVHPQKPVECFGVEASNFAKAMLEGKTVVLQTDPTQSTKDVYQRLLRYVIQEDGTDFGYTMIKNGYGLEYTYDSNPYVKQEAYIQAQKAAQTNELGLWSADACLSIHSQN